MKKIIIALVFLVLTAAVVAWDANPMYDPFEIIWNDISNLNNTTSTLRTQVDNLTDSTASAFPMYMWIEGPEGPVEPIPPYEEVPGKEGGVKIIEFNHEVYLPYDAETGQIQGSRRVTVLEVVKEVDQITPILYQYTCEGTTLPKVELKWYRINSTGQEEHYFTITLEQVRIVSTRTYMPNPLDSDNTVFGHLEKVKFLGRMIKWEGLDGTPTYQEVLF